MNTQRRGDIIPGFDCETGQAIGLYAAEWRQRTLGMKRLYSLETASIRVYVDDKLRYEIYATVSELR